MDEDGGGHDRGLSVHRPLTGPSLRRRAWHTSNRPSGPSTARRRPCASSCHPTTVRAPGSHFLAHGEPEVHGLPRLVEPGTVAVDVGANIGCYAFALCRAVGPEGHVLCVKPLEDLARLLRAAADRLGLPMTVVNCALSFQPGTADLQVPWVLGQRWHAIASLEHAGDGGETHRGRRLDDVVAGVGRRISFIKIAAEGHELAILRGSVATLRQHHPNLLVEIEQRHFPVSVQETIDYIRSQGYDGYFLDASESRRPLGQFDVSRYKPGWGHKI